MRELWRTMRELLDYVRGQIKALEDEYGFDSKMNFEDCDISGWSDAKKKAVGRYEVLLVIRTMV